MHTTLAFKRPRLKHTGTEPARALVEYVSHWLARRAPQAAGDGHTVVMFPGLATDATAFGPLRRQCRRQGYTAVDWGRGLNRGPSGDVDGWLDKLAADVAAILAQDPQARPATLVGWSLGGIYAREVAKRLSGSVRRVITLGTPFNSGADHSRVGWLYELLSRQSAHISPALSDRLATPPPVPTTSIYSRSDGVVAWQTCTHGMEHAEVEDIEVSGSHIGMAWNPTVLRIVAERLALPAHSARSTRRARPDPSFRTACAAEQTGASRAQLLQAQNAAGAP
jgi:pimeloyl-ACP methyl ester carboxylesterase